MEHKWVHSSAYSSIPADAVMAGNDTDGDVLYVGRCFHNGDMLVAKVIPSKHTAFISWQGEVLPKYHFEVLCGRSCVWQHCYEHVIPENAITVGDTELGQPVFIGRGWFEGSLTVGKVSSVHKALFIAFNGVEKRLESYEILIDDQQPTMGWSTNLLAPPPPPPIVEETKRCIEMLQDLKPYPPPLDFNPPLYSPSMPPPPAIKAAATPAPTQALGFDAVPYGPPPPYMPVLPTTMPPAEIKSAASYGMPSPQMTPASNYSMPAPQMTPASSYSTPASQITPASNYSMPASQMTPACSYPNYSTSGPQMTPASNYYPGSEQKYPPPPPSHYPSAPPLHHHHHHTTTQQNTWMSANQGYIPPNAVRAGHDIDMSEIFVCRAFHNGDLIPGKLVTSRGCAYVSHQGAEISKTHYEVLVGSSYQWIPTQSGNIVHGAVEAGRTSSGEVLYVGRAHHQGSLLCGKIQRSHQCLYVPFGGSEQRIMHYEVLTRRMGYNRDHYMKMAY